MMAQVYTDKFTAYTSVLDKVLWCTKWHKKVHCGPVCVMITFKTCWRKAILPMLVVLLDVSS